MQDKNERRQWSQAQDKALKQFYESLKLNRWSLIAQQMHAYGYPGRTGKQCRQRYKNQLDPTISHDQWKRQQQTKLFKLHDELGNKWAVISHRLGNGKTDNNVKNHFYSRLRKSLRKLNKIIHSCHKKTFREIQTKVLYKIIQASEEKFKAQPMVEAAMSALGCELKNKVMLFSYDDDDDNDEDHRAVQLIKEINGFNRNYKRKPKKFRKLGAPNMDMLDSIDSEEVRKRVESHVERGYKVEEQGASVAASSFSMAPFKSSLMEESFENFEEGSSHQQFQKKKLIVPIILAGQSQGKLYEGRTEEKIEREEMREEMREQMMAGMVGSGPEILQGLGLLQDDFRMPQDPILVRKATSQMSSDHPSNQQFKFFEESPLDMRLCAPPCLSTMKKDSINESVDGQILFR